MASQTLATTEQLVIDGTNGVTRASREGFPESSLSFGIAAVALIAAIVLVRRAPKWLPLVVFAPAALGLFHVFLERGDAPMHRGAAAAPITATIEALEKNAPWPIFPVTVVREEDDVTFPLSRYAVPVRAPVDGGVHLGVIGTSLPLECRPTGYVVICSPKRAPTP